MNHRLTTMAGALLTFLLLSFTTPVIAKVKGIYVTQPSLESTDTINYLIKRAKAVGINTFVIDFSKMSKAYQKNIELVKANDLRYIARIVIFPGGATRAQLTSQSYRDKKFALMKQAVGLGAQEIQMDYIRYASHNRPSPKNAQDVNNLIKWYRDQVRTLSVPLQIDVFGITSFHEEKRIGQNPGLFADNVDTICPMVYPSHFEPFRVYSSQPYKTVNASLNALKTQIQAKTQRPVKIIAYIEAHNYRYPLSKAKKMRYINAQINGAEDANVDGWYVWSANNKYDNLFNVMQSRQTDKIKTAVNNDKIIRKVSVGS